MARILPPLNTLRAFEATARHLNYGKAAEELEVTAAAVSHHIRLLEEDLKLPLFSRQSRQFELTHHGSSLLPVVQGAFTRMSFFVERMRRGTQRNHLTISLPPYLSAWWLVPRLERFLARYPQADFRLEHSAQSADFNVGHIDIAVDGLRPDTPGIISEFWVSFDRVPVCNRALVERAGGISSISDLRKFTLLHETSYNDWEKWFGLSNADPRDAHRGIIVDNYDVLFRAMAEAQGIALLMTSLTKDVIGKDDLVTPFGFEPAVEYSYYIYYPDGALDYGIVSDFKDWLFEEANAPIR